MKYFSASCQNISSLIFNKGLFQGSVSAPDVQSVLKCFRPHLRAAPKTASKVAIDIASILKTQPDPFAGATSGGYGSRHEHQKAGMGEPSACPHPMPPR